MHLFSAFEILGISPTSDAAAIRKAWRALVRTYHPDLAKSDAEAANRRLVEINAAYDAVSACSESDLRKFKAMAELRAKSAARKKHEQEKRAQKSRHETQSTKQKASVKEEPRAENTTTKPHKSQAGSQSTRREEKPSQEAQKTSHRSAAEAASVLSLVKKAAEKFQMARVICSSEHVAAPRSIYL